VHTVLQLHNLDHSSSRHDLPVNQLGTVTLIQGTIEILRAHTSLHHHLRRRTVDILLEA
jgi:hypothetical protein